MERLGVTRIADARATSLPEFLNPNRRQGEQNTKPQQAAPHYLEEPVRSCEQVTMSKGIEAGHCKNDHANRNWEDHEDQDNFEIGTKLHPFAA